MTNAIVIFFSRKGENYWNGSIRDLEQGKRIFPFCTNEGSGLGGSVRSIEEACPGAVVNNGISIRGCKTNESREMIEKWALSCLRNSFDRKGE